MIVTSSLAICMVKTIKLQCRNTPEVKQTQPNKEHDMGHSRGKLLADTTQMPYCINPGFTGAPRLMTRVSAVLIIPNGAKAICHHQPCSEIGNYSV